MSTRHPTHKEMQEMAERVAAFQQGRTWAQEQDDERREAESRARLAAFATRQLAENLPPEWPMVGVDPMPGTFAAHDGPLHTPEPSTVRLADLAELRGLEYWLRQVNRGGEADAVKRAAERLEQDHA